MDSFSHDARLRFITEGAGQPPQCSGPGFHKVPTFTPAPTHSKPVGCDRQLCPAERGRLRLRVRLGRVVAIADCLRMTPLVVVGRSPGLAVFDYPVKAILCFLCSRQTISPFFLSRVYPVLYVSVFLAFPEHCFVPWPS